jgi:hypothetical protein
MNFMKNDQISKSMGQLGAAFLATLLGVFLGAGCSSVKTEVNEAPIRARSFSFVATGNRPAPTYAEDRQQAHVVVQEAIVSSLSRRGLTYVKSGGDVTVAYLIIIGNNVSTTALDTYFGYSDDSSALLSKQHKNETGSERRGYYEAGTLVIDFVDPKTSKLLQRRTIQAEMLRNLPMEQRTARVQGLIEKELNTIPFAH